MVAAGPAVPFLNGTVVLREPADWRDLLARSRAFFLGHGLPWSLRTAGPAGESLARSAAGLGLSLAGAEPGMMLAPVEIRRLSVDGLSIETVTDERQLADFRRASAAGFGGTEQVYAGLYPPAVLSEPDAALYVGYLHGVPVATALCVTSNGIAGIGGVSTAPEARRRGAGAALTATALAGGLARGCDAGYLQATPMGYQVYTRMGFHRITEHQRWLPGID
jgi:GNAT superfamily N-acetyltransferase